MSEQLLKCLKELTELRGPAGYEGPVRDYMINDLYDYADEITVDPLGNLFIQKGPLDAPQILFVSHMDEVGLIVKNVDRRGMVYFEKMGIIDDKVLPGREVDIITPKGLVRGAIGTKSSHLQSAAELGKLPSHQEMWIDVGADSFDEASSLGITPGCGITYITNFRKLANDTILGKSLDDRIGCAVMGEALKRLSETDVFEKVNLCLIGTVQEEIGARGASVAGYNLDPNLAIVLDTVPCENPTVSDRLQTVHLGKGPVIRTYDIHYSTFRGCFTPLEIKDFLITTAKEAGISHQIDCISGTFLDSTTLHLTKGGIPTGAICFPRRYSHSPIEIANFSDVEKSCDLLVNIVKAFAEKPLKLGKQIKTRKP